MTILPGLRLGPYEFLSAIGAGGMGEVYQAHDTKLGRDVAIKVLPEAFAHDAERISRFQREAKMLAALNHPNIATIHGLEQSKGTSYLVMELVSGETLAERVKRDGPVPVEEALAIAKQIAEALEAAHEKGIIHRDLKPANIKVTPEGRVKVLDFGLAKLRALDETRDGGAEVTLTVQPTEGGRILGTPAYMSPEQIRGEAVDERSDMFSFGVVLYEMLAGQRAFGGTSTVAIWSAVLRDEPAPLKTPDAVNKVVRLCLAKDPAGRFQKMAEVRAALQQLSQNSASQQARPSRLPTGATNLIGRRRELLEIRDLLVREDVRLVTLSGPAGVGKTRLAIEVARETANSFEQTWFVNLENVRESHRVPSTILHGVGLREEDARSPEVCLAEYLENQNGLLVVDNFDQVVEAAPLLAQLLTGSVLLKILVTSREVLHLRAEHEYIVKSLPTGNIDAAFDQGTDIPAVKLFLERAPAIKPTPEVVRVVSEICAHLDGLPLAIELAAARSKLLSPEAMLGRLRNRFQWLGGGPRDLPERQQTLRHAIDWSYDLLAPAEKMLMQCLSVFAGSANIEAIEAICGCESETLDLLAALADKSLVLHEEDSNGNPRIRMLETIREYARERLEREGDPPQVRTRHATYYLRMGETQDGTDRLSASLYDLLEEEQTNCLAGLNYFISQGNAELTLRMGVALWPFWEARGYWTEGREQLKRILMETAGADLSSRRAKALYAAGVLADAQGDYAAARSAFEQYLALQRAVLTPTAVAAAMNNLGIVALRQGDYEASRAAYMDALAILRSMDSQLNVAQCLNNLGHVAMVKGDYATARSNYEESLAICERQGSTCDIAWTRSNLGDVAREESHLDDAEMLYSQALALFRQVSDRAGLANSMFDLGNLAMQRTQYLTAAQLYQESLVIFGDLGDRRGIAQVLEGFANMASACGRPEASLRLAAAVTAMRTGLGLKQSRTQRLQLDANVAASRAALGSRAQVVWTEGERMPLERTIAYALASAL